MSKLMNFIFLLTLTLLYVSGEHIDVMKVCQILYFCFNRQSYSPQYHSHTISTQEEIDQSSRRGDHTSSSENLSLEQILPSPLPSCTSSQGIGLCKGACGTADIGVGRQGCPRSTECCIVTGGAVPVLDVGRGRRRRRRDPALDLGDCVVVGTGRGVCRVDCGNIKIIGPTGGGGCPIDTVCCITRGSIGTDDDAVRVNRPGRTADDDA